MGSVLWIPPSSLILFTHAEFPKAANENIIAFFQGLLDQFEESLDELG